MGKYKYWHIITKVSKEWLKHNPIYYIGQVLTHSYKHDRMAVHMVDLKKKEDYPSAYTLGYLGRIESNIHDKKLCKILKQLIIEKGYKEIWDKCQKPTGRRHK